MTTVCSPGIKTCTRCNAAKPVDEFHRHAARHDGLQPWCRQCKAEAHRKNRLQNIELTRLRERTWRLAHLEESRRRKAKYLRQNPEKRAAHRAVGRELKSGGLNRPEECERCGRSDSRIYAHHEDYSRPLDVDWLCGQCHGQRHLELVAPEVLA